jgi:hypothetical protein
VPTATVVVAFVDFLITFFILLALMAWYQYPPGWKMLMLPGFISRQYGAGAVDYGPECQVSRLPLRYPSKAAPARPGGGHHRCRRACFAARVARIAGDTVLNRLDAAEFFDGSRWERTIDDFGFVRHQPA